MPTVSFQTSGQTIEVEQDANVLRTSIRFGGQVPFKCGGGICGTCRIRIVDGHSHVSKPMKKELLRLGEEKLGEGFRLACQTFVTGDVTVVWGEEAELAVPPAIGQPEHESDAQPSTGT